MYIKYIYVELGMGRKMLNRRRVRQKYGIAKKVRASLAKNNELHAYSLVCFFIKIKNVGFVLIWELLKLFLLKVIMLYSGKTNVDHFGIFETLRIATKFKLKI